MYDVLVIGGGIVGTAIARELSRYQLRLGLMERQPDVAMGATKANSAIVHGGYAESHAKLKGRLCYQGRRRFAALARELGFPFKPIGSLVLAFEEEQRAALEAMLENGKQNGLEDLVLLDREAVLAKEPNVNPAVKYGLWCEGAGVCSPFEAAVALAENAVANGLELLLNCEVAAIRPVEGGLSVTTADGRTVTARFVVNAAGLRAADVSAMAGVGGLTIRPRSGEYLLMSHGTGALVNSVLFQMPTKMGKGILVTPTVYGNLLLGPDAIDEERDDRDTHAERLYHIYREALLTTDKLDIGKFLRSFAGVRAVASGDDFIIGATAVRGFINVAGIQSPGMTSSPAIAAMVRDILADSGLDLREKPDFDPCRRPPVTVTELMPMDKLKPLLDLPEGAAGRVLCRCEQIPEAAIRDAAGRGIPVATRDAVKRRTRAGMGLCQGRFCGPRVTALMEGIEQDSFDPRTDVERDGLTRVGREEVVGYFRERGM